MKADRLRHLLFFATYAAVLASGIPYSYTKHFADKIDVDAEGFRVLMLIGIAYVGIRAALVVGFRVRGLRNAWLAIDLLVITCGVQLSGRLDSDVAMLYFWPLVTSAVERRPRVTLVVGVAVVALLMLAQFMDAWETARYVKLATRALIATIATTVAYGYCLAEVGRVKELTDLREEVALSDYRTKLSREMHDGIQHYLVRIGARLLMAEAVARRDPESAMRIATSQKLTVQQASDELRYLVRKLRAQEIDERGFIGALEDHVALFAERSSTQAQFHIDDPPRPLDPDVEQAAFRIAQEALTNVEKYAEASEVNVRLDFNGDQFICTVSDDGVGFDASAPRDEPSIEGGFGLPSMVERAASVDGAVSIESAPGEGTTVTLTVPDPYVA